jgi:hypothetical protein
MVIYSALTRASPLGLTTRPTIDCTGECPPISPLEAEVFQRAAWEEARATGLR